MEENGESHENFGLKVGLPSNSRGREIVAGINWSNIRVEFTA